jgi:integrase
MMFQIVPPLSIELVKYAFHYIDLQNRFYSSQIKTIIWTGCRPSETLSLKNKNDLFYVKVLKKRSKKVWRSFHEPIPSSPIIINHRKCSRRTLIRFFTQHFGITCREYRHLFAEHIYTLTHDLIFTSRCLYHASPHVTFRYYLQNRYQNHDDVYKIIWEP